MIGSTTPVAERPDWHPVHRANALLRSALLNAAAPFSDPAEELDRTSFATALITGMIESPVKVTCPQSLVARLNALAVSEDAFDAFDPPARGTPQGLGELRLTEADGLLHDAGTALDPVVPAVAPHVQALVREFYRRQRQANLLVAGSLVAAFLLTFGGVVLVANFATPRPADGDNRPPSRSTSIAWQRPDGYGAPARLELAAMTASRAAKGEPMLIPARSAGKRFSFERGCDRGSSDPGDERPGAGACATPAAQPRALPPAPRASPRG